MSCLEQFVDICMQNISDTFLHTVHSIQDSINTGHSICYLQYTQRVGQYSYHTAHGNMHKHKQTFVGKKIYAYEKSYLPTCKISAGNCNANVSFRFHSLFKVVSKGQ